MIDVFSFLIGGLAGAGVAAGLWALVRHWTSPQAGPAPATGNPAPQPPAGRPEEPQVPQRVSPRAVPPQWVRVQRDEVRLSERILVQLAREGRMDTDSPASRGHTQGGLVEALSSNQSAVSKVLRRLVAAGVVGEERRHVRGVNQRMKVYALTRRGELLAREVAQRRNLSLLPVRTPAPPESKTEMAVTA